VRVKNPNARLEQLRRTSLVEIEHLTKDPHPDPPLRSLPEHSVLPNEESSEPHPTLSGGASLHGLDGAVSQSSAQTSDHITSDQLEASGISRVDFGASVGTESKSDDQSVETNTQSGSKAGGQSEGLFFSSQGLTLNNPDVGQSSSQSVETDIQNASKTGGQSEGLFFSSRGLTPHNPDLSQSGSQSEGLFSSSQGLTSNTQDISKSGSQSVETNTQSGSKTGGESEGLFFSSRGLTPNNPDLSKSSGQSESLFSSQGFTSGTSSWSSQNVSSSTSHQFSSSQHSSTTGQTSTSQHSSTTGQTSLSGGQRIQSGRMTFTLPDFGKDNSTEVASEQEDVLSPTQETEERDERKGHGLF
jgi:hypothetical protein